MSLLQKLRSTFSRTGHITHLNASFEEQELDLPVGIQMHHAGIDGIDEHRLVIREYANGHSGDALLRAEWDPIQDTWELRQTRTNNIVATINGKENYSALAQAIANHIQQTY